MKKVKLTKVVLTQSEINKLDEKEKKRFIMIASIMRDLNLLQKCLVYINNNKPTDEPSMLANTTIHLFFLKTLIAKIHEMWVFLQRNKVLDENQNFSADLEKKSDEIKKFFCDEKIKNIFLFIRNKFGFHYEYWDDVDELIATALADVDCYEAWLSSDNSANEIFATSNLVIWKVVVKEMQTLGFSGDEKQLMKTLAELSLKGARIFREFSTFYLAEAFSVKWEQHKEMEIDAPLISEVTLPLIVAR